MDMMSGIAKASMDLSAARISSAAQISMLKNVMDAQKDTMAIMLESLGVGGNMSVQG